MAFGHRLGSTEGQALVFFVMAVAAAEVAVGLAIIVAIFRLRRRLSDRRPESDEVVAREPVRARPQIVDTVG